MNVMYGDDFSFFPLFLPIPACCVHAGGRCRKMEANETPRPEAPLPTSGEVKRWEDLSFEKICGIIEKFKIKPNFKLHLEWSKKMTRKIQLIDGVRPGPSFYYCNEEWAIVDGEFKLVKHSKQYDYPTINDDEYIYMIKNHNSIVLYRHYENDWDNVVENDLTIVAKDKGLLRKIARRYKDYLCDDDKKKFLQGSLTRSISMKLNEIQYENFSRYSNLFVDKFRRMLSNILKIEWDPIKGFMVNGEPDDSEELSKYLEIVKGHVGIALDWEDIDYALIADDVLIKISFFVTMSEPNVSLRIANHTTRVLRPEIIGDAVSAFYEAYERAMQEAEEKGIDTNSEEFDNLFWEWLPTYLKLSSPEEWEVEYK